MILFTVALVALVAVTVTAAGPFIARRWPPSSPAAAAAIAVWGVAAAAVLTITL